jgi:subtilisin family serine protease
MVDFPNIVITPEVERAIAASRAGGNAPIPVIILPQDGVSSEAVSEQLMAAGIAERPDRTEAYVFTALPPDAITTAAELSSVRRIWLDHEVAPQAGESIRTIQATPTLVDLDAAAERFSDITWAVLDDGIDADHPALRECQVETVNFTSQGDIGGHGTHIAGLIGGYDPAEGFQGVAPGCRLLNYKVLARPRANASIVIKALERIRTINATAGHLVIHGANLSLGYLNEENFKAFSPGHSPLCEEVNRLVSSGVFVAVSAGNFGAQAFLIGDQTFQPVYALATIADPGTAELAVTVGSTHKVFPNRYGVSVFSSKGPTGDGRAKPDLLAPGEKIRSCIPGGGYQEQSGTSQATALLSGAAVFLLHRFPDLIGQPQTVKEILLRSCRDLLRDKHFQGHGVVSLAAALQLAADRALTGTTTGPATPARS